MVKKRKGKIIESAASADYGRVHRPAARNAQNRRADSFAGAIMHPLSLVILICSMFQVLRGYVSQHSPPCCQIS